MKYRDLSYREILTVDTDRDGENRGNELKKNTASNAS
jgi:hypothetical protein